VEHRVKVRLAWIKLYKKPGNAGEVCKQYGISRLTLRKWFRRYEAEGEKGLIAVSSRPTNSPLRKRKDTDEQLHLAIKKRKEIRSKASAK
jgi:transposase-like protein